MCITVESNYKICPFHRHLRTSVGQQEFRATLIGNGTWLVHFAKLEAVPCIRTEGLRPKNQGHTIPSAAVDRDMVCLSLVDTTLQMNMRDDLYALLALAPAELPQRVGVDHSFVEHWNALSDKYSADPVGHAQDAALDVARDTGSLASFDVICPEVLHVYVGTAALTNPKAWPFLRSTPDADIEIFEFFLGSKLQLGN